MYLVPHKVPHTQVVRQTHCIHQVAEKGYILGNSEVLRELPTNPRETAFR